MESTTYFLLVPQLLISLVTWAQIVFSINRFRGICNFRYTDVWGLLLLTHGAFVRWIAVLAVRSHSITYQASAATIGSIIGWTSFVVIFNQDFVLPTRQQSWALVMSLIVTLLWEVNARMVFSLND